jgi:thymidylate synthase (FAD)
MSKIDLIDHMGDDTTIVNAARVSFDKCIDKVMESKDEKLIKYLAEHGHWSPFSHGFATFKIKASIFVARQLQKHQVGLAWNEVSRRYVDSEPDFWYPLAWRERSEDKKQGSTSKEVPNNEWFDRKYRDVLRLATETYKDMVKEGVCPEQARAVLPQSMYTSWYWSGSLYAFARVCNLRLQGDAQAETKFVAESISYNMRNLFPISWKHLVKHITKREESMSEQATEIPDESWPGPGV